MDESKVYHSDLSLNCLKIRVNIDTDEEVEKYISVLNSWISTLQLYPYEQYTAGIHDNAKHKHFHYHILLRQENIPKELLNPSYYFAHKQYGYLIKKKGLKDFPKYSIKVESVYTDDLQPNIDTAINKFLRYPLKEGKPLSTFCSFSTSTLAGMCSTAEEEFRFAQEQADKNRLAEENKITKWNQIRDHLDGLGIEVADDPAEIWIRISKYMSADTIPPTFKTIDTMTERYVIYKQNKVQIMAIAMRRTKHLSNSLI